MTLVIDLQISGARIRILFCHYDSGVLWLSCCYIFCLLCGLMLLGLLLVMSIWCMLMLYVWCILMLWCILFLLVVTCLLIILSVCRCLHFSLQDVLMCPFTLHDRMSCFWPYCSSLVQRLVCFPCLYFFS